MLPPSILLPSLIRNKRREKLIRPTGLQACGPDDFFAAEHPCSSLTHASDWQVSHTPDDPTGGLLMAVTHETPWIDRTTGTQCCDALTCTLDHTRDRHAVLSTANAGVDLVGPNMAAINLRATLAGTGFAETLLASLRDWRDALDRQIETHTREAAMWIAPATGDVIDSTARVATAQEHLDAITVLIERRQVADQLLDGATDQHYR
ncbi:hypothetical protein [Gordonia soli]|uniref:Uncharacterized protein n=1 Tax=Gordonia soli NBRC 108243 TaxID=1223545 RepID=M0QLV5_9ACTN|nr:hypothetical protein [Gordonia soli]GAC69563.1 hypothetical protein GS4_26_00100 [Gordonia soli NBRC 108243]